MIHIFSWCNKCKIETSGYYDFKNHTCKSCNTKRSIKYEPNKVVRVQESKVDIERQRQIKLL